MDIPKVRLGRTELYVTKTSFGALPVQRIGHEAARKLLRRAYESGINYFDTANMYTDSEEKIGEALHDVRQNIVISTKSGGKDKKTVREHIELRLRRMQTDNIDLFQFHNPAELPDPEDPDGPYTATSASPTTVLAWPRPPLPPETLRRCSFPSATSARRRTSSSSAPARRRTWASSP